MLEFGELEKTIEFRAPACPDNPEQLEVMLKNGVWHFLLFPDKFHNVYPNLPSEYIDSDFVYREIKPTEPRASRAFIVTATTYEGAIKGMAYLAYVTDGVVEIFVSLPEEIFTPKYTYEEGETE